MKLRTRKSYFNNLPEGNPPIRILPRITRLIYFLALFSIIAGVLYLLAMRIVFFTGRGQVEHQKTVLSSAKGGKIVQLVKTEGDFVVQGEVLAQIARPDECEDGPDLRIEKLIYDIKSMQAKLAILQEQLKSRGQSVNTEILYRALEIGSASFRRKLKEQTVREEKLRKEVELLKAEITVRQKELVILQQLLSKPPDPSCRYETIIAPFDGLVYLVKAKEHEYIRSGKPLFVLIADNAPVYIDAYTKGKYLQYITPGSQMTIIFPDRYQSIGRVEQISSSAQAVVKRQRKDYIPISTMIRIKLVPPGPEEEKIWQKYDRIVLKVRGRKL
ncbi:HlyD family secretion protein [Desulfolithobacter sp.]